jgi:hypothetical protein
MNCLIQPSSADANREHEAAITPKRTHIIRRAWKERGSAVWDREVHGRGLASLNIAASTNMRSMRPGQPIPPYDNLEFRLERSTKDGETISSIVCEGVVVETWPA